MKRKQLIAMWCGIIAIVLMGLFPPWHIKAQVSQRDYGFAFILSSPGMDNIYPMINTTQLFIQCFVVGLITTGYIITFKDKKPENE